MSHDFVTIDTKLSKLKVDLMALAEMNPCHNMKLNEQLVKDLIALLREYFTKNDDGSLIKETESLLEDAVQVVVDSFPIECSQEANKKIAKVKADLVVIKQAAINKAKETSTDEQEKWRAQLEKIVHQKGFDASVLLHALNQYDRPVQVMMLNTIMYDDKLFHQVVLGENIRNVSLFCDKFPDYADAVFSKLKKDNALFLELTKEGYQSFSKALEQFPKLYKHIAIKKLLTYERALENAMQDAQNLVAFLMDIDDAALKFKVVDRLLANEKIRSNVFKDISDIYRHLCMFYHDDIKQKAGEDWMILKASVGLAQYLSKTDSRFLNKKTDVKQDGIQAKMYDILLTQYAETPLEKKIVIYAILENNQDKLLQEYVCNAMEMVRLSEKNMHHQDKIADIKNYLESSIKNELTHLGLTMSQLMSGVIDKINAEANGGKAIQTKTYEKLIGYWRKLQEDAQPKSQRSIHHHE